jgi:hypothetical protein
MACAAGETSIVHEYVDGVELGLDCVECSLDRRLICHFKRQREHFDIWVRVLDVGFGLFQGLDLSGSDVTPLAPASVNASEGPWPKMLAWGGDLHPSEPEKRCPLTFPGFALSSHLGRTGCWKKRLIQTVILLMAEATFARVPRVNSCHLFLWSLLVAVRFV